MENVRVRIPEFSLTASVNPKLAETILWNRQRFDSSMTLVEVLVDLITVALSVLFSYWVYQALHIGRTVHYSLAKLVLAAVAFAMLYVILLDRDGAYARRRAY